MSDSESISGNEDDRVKQSHECSSGFDNEQIEDEEIEGVDIPQKEKSTMTIDGFQIYKSYCPYIDEESLNLRLINQENSIREMIIDQIKSINKHEKDDRRKVDQLYNDFHLFMKRFLDIELINDKGPLAIKVNTFGLRLEHAEHARSRHEKEFLDDFSDIKKDVKNFQQRLLRMTEYMNTYDKQLDDRTKENQKTKK